MRIAAAAFVLAVALAAPAEARDVPGSLEAHAYVYADSWRGWPVAPVDAQHPIRGSFLDPRPDGYHIGVDVNVRDDRPEPDAPPQRTHRVYALEGGIVSLPDNVARVGCVNRKVEVGHFSYWHVDPIGTVAAGQPVAPGQMIGWTCTTMWHVHVSEWVQSEGRRVWVNPLHRGGKLAPFADTRPPRVHSVRFFAPAATDWVEGPTDAIAAPGAGRELPRLRLRGLVDVRALVSDPQSFLGWFADAHPTLAADHRPQRVRIELTRLADGRRVVARDVFRADALDEPGRLLPPFDAPVPFRVHYAPGTLQNLGAHPCVLGLQPRSCQGRYWLRLFARSGGAYWNTRLARDGRYRLVVRAWDAAGNAASTAVTIGLRNGLRSRE